MENVGDDLVVQLAVDRRFLGRVTGGVYSLVEAASSIASAVGGVLVAATSPRAVFALAGIGNLAAGALIAPSLLRATAPPSALQARDGKTAA